VDFFKDISLPKFSLHSVSVPLSDRSTPILQCYNPISVRLYHSIFLYNLFNVVMVTSARRSTALQISSSVPWLLHRVRRKRASRQSDVCADSLQWVRRQDRWKRRYNCRWIWILTKRWDKA